MALHWRTAWITGASSGIGRALALALARAGVKVAVSARRADQLAALAAEHPGIHAFPLDVTDAANAAAVAGRIATELGPIDLAILNAGKVKPMDLARFDAAVAADMMAVNYQGIVNCLAALLPQMRARRSGHIALISSIAGYRGLPGAAGYCSSKAAVISLAESLEPELDAEGIDISIINPGFVETPMTAGARHPLPFIMSAEDAARRILRRLERRHYEIAFPWRMTVLAKIARMMPNVAFLWVMSQQLAWRQPRQSKEAERSDQV